MMNHSIIDPYQGEFPEVIEEYLDHGLARCIAFNRRGTLLAAGCTNGSCVIWDFETRGVARELIDEDCASPITSVCWSKCGRQILTSSTGKLLTVWDVANARKIRTISLPHTALFACFHPGMRNPSLLLACPLSSAPILLDMASNSQVLLEVQSPYAATEPTHHTKNKHHDGSANYTSAAATFNSNGDLIFVGNSKGQLLFIDTETRKIQAIYQVPGGSLIRQIAFSKSGKFMLTNSTDRSVRVFKCLLPPYKSAATLKEWASSCSDGTSPSERLKLLGSQSLEFVREFHDPVNRLPWKSACFSGDDNWVIAGPSSKGEHKICVWDILGQLVKMLEGPKDVLSDLSWHPTKPLIASVSMTGLIYIWARDYTENWSAFAPDFKELEENEEYIEREDEFDMMPETEKVKVSFADEDEEVDIINMEKFSDTESDGCSEDLHYLPATPLPDDPETQEQSTPSPSRPENSTPSQSDRSPATEEGKFRLQDEGASLPNGSSLANGSSHEEPSQNGRVKRKRRLSEKGAEMQAEKGKKTVFPNVTSTKRKPISKSNTPSNISVSTENASLDSNSKMRSASKDTADEFEGNSVEEVPASY